MRRSTWLVALGAALAVVAGQTAVAEGNAQQEKMTSCNADAKAKALKGDEHKAFMKTCLSDKGAAEKQLNPQQEKMKACAADAKAKELKGTDRQHFMRDCLKGKPAAH